MDQLPIRIVLIRLVAHQRSRTIGQAHYGTQSIEQVVVGACGGALVDEVPTGVVRVIRAIDLYALILIGTTVVERQSILLFSLLMRVGYQCL